MLSHAARTRSWQSALCLAAAFVLCLTSQTDTASAQTAANVLLVTNSASPASNDIAAYYAQKRSVPDNQILRLTLPITDEISREVYARQIERPVADWILSHSAQDRILYIVLTKDLPLRIAGTLGQNGTMASVDSELTFLYQRLIGLPAPITGAIPNPYFAGNPRDRVPGRFSHKTDDIYLVTRLDGYTVNDVKGLIDRGMAPAHTGTIVLDGRGDEPGSIGNRWLTDTAAALRAIPGWGDHFVLDTTAQVLAGASDVLGYYSWGSTAPESTLRAPKLAFAPGALAGEFVSTDARTFVEPASNWTINQAGAPHRGSSQSLIGDLIRAGVTGASGNVAEPYLNGSVRPDLLFPAYLRGFNLAEAYYQAMPSLSWQGIVVGDPLCAPFKTTTLAEADLDPGIDPQTELPVFYSGRRISAFVNGGALREAAIWLAKSEARQYHGDSAGMRAALEEATRLDARLIPSNLVLGGLYEADKNWDAALARYQMVLAQSPEHPAALNNTAYILATYKNEPSQALPLALRAFAASRGNPDIADTVAWTYHLLENDAAAETYSAIALRAKPDNADIQLHAALVAAGIGKLEAASKHLAGALKAKPELGERDDVKKLQTRLGTAK